MKTKLLLLISLLVISASAQVILPPTSPYFAFNVSPLQATAVVDKYAGGNQQISWPIIVALPPGTAGASRAYRILSPTITSTGNSALSFYPSFNVLQPGQTDNVTITVNVDAFAIGQYGVPIFVTDLNSNLTVTVSLTLTVTDLRSLSIPPPTTRTVPHIASGAGWRTIVQFTNPSNLPSVVEMNLFAPNGVPTSLRLRDGRFSSVIEEVIPGYGTTSIVFEDVFTKETLTGSAEIKPLLNNPVGVTIIYETTDANAHEAGLQATAVTSGLLTLFYDNTGGRVTGVALLNSLNYPQNLTITYYDDGGSVLDTQIVTLAAKGQTSFVATTPKIANRVGVFTVSAPIPALTGFALRFNKDMQFIPVMPF
jgi:hypothetical protein